MSHADDTAHLIDTEPVLLFGCNSIEILTLGAFGFVVELVFGVILLSPLGLWYLAIPFGFFAAIGTIIIGGKRLGKAKEGKPDGYYNRYLLGRLASVGLRNSIICRAGHWRNRR